jgi:hypothetical protein
VAHYHAFLDAMLAAGITPYATMYHWDLPQVMRAQERTVGRSKSRVHVPAVASSVGCMLTDVVPRSGMVRAARLPLHHDLHTPDAA